MSPRKRLLLIAFSLLGLAASVGALYVHYRLLTEADYSSFCDISATVSCQQVFESQYGTVFGVPVAAGGAIWSALMLILAVWGLRAPYTEVTLRVAGYVFILSTLGLAATFYYAYASFFLLRQACPLCMTMYVSVIGIFLVSASTGGSLGTLPSRVGPDLGRMRRNSTAFTLAIAWLVASVGLVVLFPRGQAASAEEQTVAAEPVVPVEALTAAQLAEWEMWLDTQPRVEGAQATGSTKVLVMKFNDYQCPACRQTYTLYKGILDKYEASHPGVFRFESRDFPLETECGLGGVHGAACEAAAAVRMAREKGRDRQLEQVLFARQSPSMTRDDVKAALREVAQVTDADFDARYPTVLEEVRADAQLGNKLGVTGTPTFFINGIRISSLRPAYFDAAIAHELRKAGVTVAAPGA